jgi:hypothetical protein
VKARLKGKEKAPKVPLRTMKINIAHPATGAQKMFEIDDDRKLYQTANKRYL